MFLLLPLLLLGYLAEAAPPSVNISADYPHLRHDLNTVSSIHKLDSFIVKSDQNV